MDMADAVGASGNQILVDGVNAIPRPKRVLPRTFYLAEPSSILSASRKCLLNLKKVSILGNSSGAAEGRSYILESNFDPLMKAKSR